MCRLIFLKFFASILGGYRNFIVWNFLLIFYFIVLPKSQILTKESIEDNPKDVETTIDNPSDISKRDINLNMNDVVPLDDTSEETRNKHISRVPKNHPI